jgi:phosphatidylglycerol lysyltransferase
MFAPQGASWIAMGGPVGPEDTREALVWEFCGAAEAAGARPVFYGVPEGDLPLVLDLGLAPYKLGEGARVPLAGFSLEGGSKRGLRRTRRRLDEAGCVVEVLPPEAVGALLPELRRVSDAWLGGKTTDEKGFSLGVFDETYLRNFPLAVVRAPPTPPAEAAGGTGDASSPADGPSPPGDASPLPIVAFANVWANDRIAGGEQGHPEAKAEFSLDLMRFDRARAPDSVMEYLFIEMMLWGAAEGYGSFGLGMAPLAGLEPGGEAPALAPLWNRFGGLLFRYGENFYNFQGLRAYKEKFDPEWSSRYLAVPRGRMELAGALVDVTTLISGGFFGLIPR